MTFIVNNAVSASISSSSKRNFFYGPPSSWEGEYEELIARRNKNIVMHPLGHGQHILPGNYVVKIHPKTGAEKKVMLEHALGYFWAFKVWGEYRICVFISILGVVTASLTPHQCFRTSRRHAGIHKTPKELSLTDNKPILSNKSVIPAVEAEPFPALKGLVNLHEEVVDIPDFFTRNNREFVLQLCTMWRRWIFVVGIV
jgi:hypothetical protein